MLARDAFSCLLLLPLLVPARASSYHVDPFCFLSITQRFRHIVFIIVLIQEESKMCVENNVILKINIFACPCKSSKNIMHRGIYLCLCGAVLQVIVLCRIADYWFILVWMSRSFFRSSSAGRVSLPPGSSRWAGVLGLRLLSGLRCR